jgi:D-serine deaminase-like pyridoxal phosphate-dependent protein
MDTPLTGWIPAQPGAALEDVDTPALILDLDRFDANLSRLMQAAATTGVRVRPHAKSHKCVQIARRQIAAGAAGICCQKVAEAAVFLAGGISDVLISNEVVGDHKLRRLAELACAYPNARLGVCVDDAGVVRRMGAICAMLGARLDVYVEIDVGQDRCGVSTAAAAEALGREITAAPQLRLAGLQAYAGSAQHLRSINERRAAAGGAAARAAEVRTALRAVGLSCEIVTGGGTGTFLYEAASQVFDEIQPGSYALMDVDYARNIQDPDAPRFAQALTILATVMSVRHGPRDADVRHPGGTAGGNAEGTPGNATGTDEAVERITLDAGLKAFSVDSGPAEPDFPGWQVRGVSDEHTVLERTSPPGVRPPRRGDRARVGAGRPLAVPGEGRAPALGDKVHLVPSHCDPTVNLHDWIVAVRGRTVEAVWRVDARGALF